MPPAGVMVISAVRPGDPLFASAVQFTVPEPVPELPDVMCAHDWSLTAVHCKALSEVVTDIDPNSPGVPTLWEVGLMVRVPPDCVTVTETAEPWAGVAVMVAVRAAALGSGLAVY